MNRNGWGLWDDRGFLLFPDPQTLHQASDYLLTETIDQLEVTAHTLPDKIEGRKVRVMLDSLPLFDLTPLEHAPESSIARAFQIYSYFASAYIHAPDAPSAHRLPQQIAVPLVNLSEMVARPPIMAYADYNLANWVRLDPKKPIVVENMRLLQKFTHLPDSAWFSLIHVQIEAEATPALMATLAAQAAMSTHDDAALLDALESIASTLDTMRKTLQRMPEGCQPHRYYHEIRPYMLGFSDVIYEGVAEYENKPQTFLGETGAQSSIIPMLVQFLGLQHERNTLTQYLRIMHDYMPQAHRRLLARIDADQLRDYVAQNREELLLQDAYNHTLQRLSAFRQLHLRFAASYIANQSSDSIGTGGTNYMDWLQRLIDETETQRIE